MIGNVVINYLVYWVIIVIKIFCFNEVLKKCCLLNIRVINNIIWIELYENIMSYDINLSWVKIFFNMIMKLLLILWIFKYYDYRRFEFDYWY